MAASEYIGYSGGKTLEPFTGAKTYAPEDRRWTMETFNTPEYNAYLARQEELNPTIQTTGKASDILASVTRAQWADVKNNFLPIEKDVLNQLTFNNASLLPDSINAAQGTAAGMTDTMNSVRDRNMARYGMNLDPQAQDAMKSSDTLSKTTNMVNAGNFTRQRLLDRDKELMMSGISAINAQ